MKRAFVGIREKKIARNKSFLSGKSIKRNNILLFVSLFLLIFFRPVFSLFISNGKLIFSSLLSLLIITAVSSLDFEKKKFIRLTYAGFFTLVLVWLDYFTKSLDIRLTSFFALIVFSVYVTYSMIVHVARQKDVTATLILNSINSYLLMGIIFSMFFLSVEIFYNIFYSDNIIHTINFGYTQKPTLFDFIYYAFITMTTVGYGEITPTVPITKALAMLTAVTSQLYLAILVAMLVSKFLSKKN